MKSKVFTHSDGGNTQALTLSNHRDEDWTQEEGNIVEF
jgi:hypothetical protein